MTHILARSLLVLFASSALGGAAAAEPSARIIPAVDRADGAPAELILAAHHRRHHGAATTHKRHKAAAQAATDDEADGGVAGAGGEVVEGEGKTYTVKRGDTLAKVADKLGVDVEDLKKANRIKGSAIKAGQELKVPGGGSEAYVAARGDNLAAIAKRFGVTEKALRSASGLSRRAKIKAGEKLSLPEGAKDHGAPKTETTGRRGKSRAAEPQSAEEEAAPETRGGRAAVGRIVEVPGPGRTYRVRKGDTLEKVADKLDVSVAQLKKDNHLRKSLIHPGQVLKAPGGTAKAYVVGPRDTIYTVAERFGVTVKRLRAENGLGRRGAIHTGQKLRLPAGYRDRGPEAGEETRPPRLALPPVRPQPYIPPPTTPRPYVPPSTTPSAPAVGPQATPAPSDAQISEMGRGRFVWPVQGQVLSTFGPGATGQRNDGINIRATMSQPVRSAAAGEVVYAGDQVPGFGNLVLIKHADGWVTAYGHLSKVEVRMQQKVTQGQEIGLAGATGGVSEPQLHFEVRYAPNPMERARPIDPKLVLPSLP